MGVRILIRIGIFTVLGILVALSVGLMRLQHEYARALQAEDFVVKLATTAHQLNALTAGYQLNPREHTREQWLQQQSLLSSVLDGNDSPLPPRENNRFYKQSQQILSLFQDAVAVESSSGAADLETVRKPTLFKRLQMEIQGVASRAVSLGNQYRQELADQAEKIRQQITSLIILFVIMLLSLWLVIDLGLIAPMRRLSRRITGLADTLDKQADSKISGEFADLTQSVDKLAEHLRQTMVSRDELAAEMEQRKRYEEALQYSKARYRELVDHMCDGVAVYEAVNDGEDFVFKDCNRAAENIGAIQREVAVGQSVRNVFPGVERLGLLDVFRRVWQSGKPEHCPSRLYKDQRLHFWADNYVFKLPNGDIVAIFEDITERKQAEDELQLAATVFTHAREGIIITAPDGAILNVNDAFERITGYSRAEVIGQNPRILSSGRQGPEFYAAMWHDISNKGSWAGEVWNRRKNGDVYAELLTISAVRSADGEILHYVGMCFDITAQKENQKQLERIAHYDALTHLPNRVLLADRLYQATARAKRHGQQLAVVYLDFDGFKAINDSHGHQVGDQLLVKIAERLEQVIRDGDTIARLGGDEFVVVLIDVESGPAIEALLGRLILAVSLPVYVQDLIIKISASLGVTFYPQKEDLDAEQLLRQADQAMYQAKLAGKNRFHLFDHEHDRSLRGQHESLERIRQALDEHEFVLYYQPKVNMRTGEVIGVEALIRWQHPTQGILSPGTFLPMIEDQPIAVDLGNWVLTTAIAQIAAWHAQSLDMPVSVNVGARQLQHPDFVMKLARLLDAHPAIKPGDLELEVLETSALEDMRQISQVMSACHEMGVDFALDDFGTGYSSLTYLKRLPVSCLKIDQSFVRDMLDDPDDLSILEGVISLASAFNREAIAEGVETVEHGDMLLQLGCEQAQGYAIAYPMPAGDIVAWVKRWRPNASWQNQRSVNRADLPILFAGVEHRAWIRAIQECLDNKRMLPPALDHHQCRFGQWLDKEAFWRYAKAPQFEAIETLHMQVHTLAKRLLQLHRDKQTEVALQEIPQLYNLRDQLLGHLHTLIQHISANNP